MVGYSYKATGDNVSCNDFMDLSNARMEEKRIEFLNDALAERQSLLEQVAILTEERDTLAAEIDQRKTAHAEVLNENFLLRLRRDDLLGHLRHLVDALESPQSMKLSLALSRLAYAKEAIARAEGRT
jgi:hypothetical protein